MRSLINRGIILLALTCASVSANALSVLYQSLPDYFSTSPSTLVTSVIGGPCTSMTSIRFVLPCNPAFISQDGPPMYNAQLFIGSDAAQIEKLQTLLSRNESPELVQSLFADPMIKTEASAQMTFRSQYFGAALVPERLAYASIIRNQAYPVVAIEATQERSAIVQTGGEVYDNFYAGLQLRLVDRQFVASEFSLFDALSEPTSQILPVQNQDVLYVEPGIAYLLKDELWQPRATLKLSNVGFANQQYSQIPMQPIVDCGFGVAPPVSFGELEVALNYHVNGEDTLLADDLRIGASYSVGLMQAIVGLGRNNSAVGVISSVGSVRAGITFSEELVDVGDGSTQSAKTVFTEFGVVY